MRRAALSLGLCLALGAGCASGPEPTPPEPPPRASAPVESEESKEAGRLACPSGAELQLQDGGATQLCVLNGATHGPFARFGPGGGASPASLSSTKKPTPTIAPPRCAM